MEHWTDKLVAMDACSEAVEWAKSQPDFETAWATCERADWMLWAAQRRTETAKPVYVRLAAGFARGVIHLVPADTPIPLKQIKAAEAWLANPTEENRWAAGEAAGASWAAERAAAARAAWEATEAAWAAATWASWAAAWGAEAAEAAWAAATCAAEAAVQAAGAEAARAAWAAATCAAWAAATWASWAAAWGAEAAEAAVQAAGAQKDESIAKANADAVRATIPCPKL